MGKNCNDVFVTGRIKNNFFIKVVIIYISGPKLLYTVFLQPNIIIYYFINLSD